LDEALGQLLDWGIAEIQEYGRKLSEPLISFFREKGSRIEDESYRAHHLMGLPLPPGTDGKALVGELQSRNVYVSLRGSNIRISVNVFNTEEDIRELMAAL
jgi:selenocysteine lyase/cysteine desulfurase